MTFDNFSTGWRDALKFGPLIEGDSLDKKSLDRAFKEFSPSAVMHFAALSDAGKRVISQNLYWKSNVLVSC